MLNFAVTANSLWPRPPPSCSNCKNLRFMFVQAFLRDKSVDADKRGLYPSSALPSLDIHYIYTVHSIIRTNKIICVERNYILSYPAVNLSPTDFPPKKVLWSEQHSVNKEKPMVTSTRRGADSKKKISLWAGRGPAVHCRRAVSSRFEGAPQREQESWRESAGLNPLHHTTGWALRSSHIRDGWKLTLLPRCSRDAGE